MTKKFDQFKAVADLNFDVSEGEVLGFLGPNGAGKSTTMKAVSYTHLTLPTIYSV